jgi:hypothetical protein
MTSPEATGTSDLPVNEAPAASTEGAEDAATDRAPADGATGPADDATREAEGGDAVEEVVAVAVAT